MNDPIWPDDDEDPLPPSADDMVRGLVVIAGIAILLALVLIAFEAYAAEPPALVVYERDSLTHEPAGPIESHPADSSVHLCADISSKIVMVYDPFTRVFKAPTPCASLFKDGFEP